MNLTEHKLSSAAREKLPANKFVFPKSRKYPIEDKSHARNALARVSQHGSPSQKAKVRSAVHSKYPGIGECQVPPLGAAELQEMSGLPPQWSGHGGVSPQDAPWHDQGYSAGMKGKRRNPYREGTRAAEEWAAGNAAGSHHARNQYAGGVVERLLDEYHYPGMEPEELQPDVPTCPQCGGEGHFIGALGHTAHFRCRQCGWDFSEDGYQTPPKANIMPGGSMGPVGDTTAIGISGGGN